MIIVDSPGIGESEIMDNIVVNYLPNAFAFIYVINSGMAGGVQKDRVRVFYKPLKHIFAFCSTKWRVLIIWRGQTFQEFGSKVKLL